MNLVGSVAIEDFTITNDSNSLITGLVDGDFTRDLFDPDNNEVSSSITVTVTELGGGSYRTSFIPNKIGKWYLIIYHPTYFPWGKANNISVLNSNSDTLESIIQSLVIMTTRALGLMQENQVIDNTVHDSAGNMLSSRVRLFPSKADADAGTGVIAEYEMTASWNQDVNDNWVLESYKMTKV